MAACYLKLEQYGKCIQACSQALVFGDFSNAYFRCGQANLELGNTHLGFSMRSEKVILTTTASFADVHEKCRKNTSFGKRFEVSVCV